MRHACLVTLGLGACLGAPLATASDVGLPTHSFAQSWTALPTGRLTPSNADETFDLHEAHAVRLSGLGSLLDDAFASARNESERRGIALSEMTTSWDQAKRSAFQRLRDAASAYAGTDALRHDRFVATLERVVDGTGRSAASDGSAPAALGRAYAAALARHGGQFRAPTAASQKAWRAYAMAFVTFADLQTPGRAASVRAELERQRTKDLMASMR